MKKAARIFLITAGAVVLLLAVAVIALFQPAVQTWVARKAVADLPGCEVAIGRVNASLNKVELASVRVTGPGLALDMPAATIEMPLLGLLSDKVNVKNVVAKGWTLDLSQPAPEAKTPSPSPAPPAVPDKTPQPAPESGKDFAGIFEMLKLPLDLTVGAADLAGAIILPPDEPGCTPARVAVTIRGGKLAPGSDGRFDIALETTIAEPGAPVSNIQIQSNLVVRMGSPREIQSLVFESDARAAGGQFPQGARLRIDVAASKSASGEDYVIGLKSQEAGGEKKLFQIKATNPAGPEGLNALWAVDLRDADLTPFTGGLGLKLPSFTATGQGTLTANDNLGNIRAAGKLSAEAGNLDVLGEALSALGLVNASADFDVMIGGDLVRISAFSADLASALPVATVRTLQPLEINLSNGEIKVPEIQSDLVRVDVHGLPPEWARPFVKAAGVELSGGPVRGSFTGRAQGAGYSVRSVTPFTLGGLSVSRGGKELARELDVSTDFSAEYSNAGLEASVSGFSIRSNGAALATVSAARVCVPLAAPAGKDGAKISATGNLRAGLAALLAQPAAAGACALTDGGIEVEFSCNVREGVSAVAAKIAATGLRAGDTTLPKISADARADIHDNGVFEMEAPMALEMDGRKSDIRLGVTLKPGDARPDIEASVAGGEIHVGDVLALTASVPASDSEPPAAAARQPRSGAAFWDAVSGELKLALKSVVFSPEIRTDITGTVKIAPSLLSIENLSAHMEDGAEVNAAGTLKYETETASGAYVTDARLTMTNFDPGPFLRAANPGKKPTVEGKFDITGLVSGTAPAADKIASTVAADLTLTSRGGKFHGFSSSARASGIEQMQKPSSSQSALSAIGGAVLSMIGMNNENSPNLEKVKAGARILDRLSEIEFDQINLDASYRPGREIDIRNFGLLSPDMRISGSGSLGNKPGLSLLRQALSMDLQMAVRGEQADDLRLINVLRKEADSLGYAPLLKDFNVDGTLASFGVTTLVKQIMLALAQK